MTEQPIEETKGPMGDEPTNEVPITPSTRFCYYVDQSMYREDFGGFVPSVVYENQPGHYPMMGDGNKGSAPWVWGPTFEEARAHCDSVNERRGLTKDDCDQIIASSMTAAADEPETAKDRAEKQRAAELLEEIFADEDDEDDEDDEWTGPFKVWAEIEGDPDDDAAPAEPEELGEFDTLAEAEDFRASLPSPDEQDNNVSAWEVADKLAEAVEGVLEWAQGQGGYDEPCWNELKAARAHHAEVSSLALAARRVAKERAEESENAKLRAALEAVTDRLELWAHNAPKTGDDGEADDSEAIARARDLLEGVEDDDEEDVEGMVDRHAAWNDLRNAAEAMREGWGGNLTAPMHELCGALDRLGDAEAPETIPLSQDGEALMLIEDLKDELDRWLEAADGDKLEHGEALVVRATEFITRKTSPLEPTNRFWKIGETQWAGAGSVLVPDMTANPSGTRFVEVIDAKEGYTIALVQVDEGDADQEADLQRIVAAGVCRACAPGPLVDELRKSLSHVTDYLDEYVSAVHLHETHEGAKRDIQAARILLASTGGTSPTSGPEEITEAGQGVLLQIYSWLWQHDSDGCGCDGEEVRAGEWGTNKEIGGADTVEFLSNILPFQGPPKTPVPGPWNSAEESTRLARQVATAAVIRGACPTDDEMRQEIEIAADKYREAVRDWFANNDASELYVPDDARVYPADDGQGATVLVPIYIDAGDLPA